ncbi:monofunctional biosynthetic peptidoglycan transglycosylase [Alkalisalibacterium limincola]|uniref:Biosynthetic peptidoglycan transglycosylase n=1 Tax=Alkalisalibacterium limincola TaxID=2699169 RepID=A0A5C8KRK4_9GAMM|nr:monofunctional biosynthetic peptidoglycan transglycosylase [Alkalisalibacterium limincola]
MPVRLLRLGLLLVLAAIVLSIAQVVVLRFVDPPTSAFMLARTLEHWRAPGEDFRIDYRWRDFDAVSPHLLMSVIASEDQNFAHHRGFDLDAIDEALSGGSRRGASTISQQVAKNLFLWGGRSWVRKGLEAWYTGWIELTWPKRRILEVYVNIAEFGDGIYGAEAAAQRHFGISASALDPARSARLAAVLPSPRRYSPTQPGPHVQQRAAWVQRQVVQLGGQEYLEACCGR